MVIDRELLSPDGLHDTAEMYSHVARGAGLVFVAGQVARNPVGELVGRDDVVAQARQVFENLRVALQAGGSGLAGVVKLTVYLTKRSDLDGYRRAREELLPVPRPPTTLVFVDGLADTGYLIEIEAIALVTSPKRDQP